MARPEPRMIRSYFASVILFRPDRISPYLLAPSSLNRERTAMTVFSEKKILMYGSPLKLSMWLPWGDSQGSAKVIKIFPPGRVIDFMLASSLAESAKCSKLPQHSVTSNFSQFERSAKNFSAAQKDTRSSHLVCFARAPALSSHLGLMSTPTTDLAPCWAIATAW